MKELKFELTVDETNLILEALGGMPFKTVFGLINKIQQQAGSQLNGQANSMEDGASGKAEAPQIQKPK